MTEKRKKKGFLRKLFFGIVGLAVLVVGGSAIYARVVGDPNC